MMTCLMTPTLPDGTHDICIAREGENKIIIQTKRSLTDEQIRRIGNMVTALYFYDNNNVDHRSAINSTM